MPAFIKGDSCLINASTVQEIHHSGSSGGIVGVKTAVENPMTHGSIVARLVGNGMWSSTHEMLGDEKRDAAKAAKVAESLAGNIMRYAKAPDSFLLAFNAETQDWTVTQQR